MSRYEELIEAVAVALCDHPTGGIGEQPRRWRELHSELVRDSWREVARKALSALDAGAEVVKPGKLPSWIQKADIIANGKEKPYILHPDGTSVYPANLYWNTKE